MNRIQIGKLSQVFGDLLNSIGRTVNQDGSGAGRVQFVEQEFSVGNRFIDKYDFTNAVSVQDPVRVGDNGDVRHGIFSGVIRVERIDIQRDGTK